MELLNEKLPEPITQHHFRPNLYVKTELAHIEDGWGKFSINDVHFDGVKRCSRCKIVDVDPLTGQLQNQVLKALMSYRRTERGVLFGENLIHLNTGLITLGDFINF